MSPETGVPGGRERSPRNIAHYAIRDRLGKGAMGVVYRAVDERTRQEVALKVMVSDLEGDQETRGRFFREAQIAGQLRHRNVVNVFDSGEDGSRLYIAMELLNGCTLTDFLKQSEALDLETRVDLMIQVCQGLTVAHDAGIYHRDIKPANLFVCEDRRLKILDFGVARLADSNMTLTGYILGTPDYMSPEQARGADVDERSDIFSAAAVFYLMLTGRKPFAAADLPAVLNKVLRVDPLPIREDEAPEALTSVISKALSKDPGRRQQNTSQFIDELMTAEASISRTTRQVGVNARKVAEELVALSARRRELAVALELDEAGDPWRMLVEKYPVLQRGPFALGGFPLRRAVINAITSELEAQVGPLRDQVPALEVAHQALIDGRDLLQTGNVDGAVARFAAARRAIPASPAITRELDACARVLAQRREQEALIEQRLKSATEAAARQDWQTVLAIAATVEELHPGNAEAGRLRAQAMRTIESERERQVRERQSAVERAQRAAEASRLMADAEQQFADNDFVAAERSAAQAVAINGDDAACRELLDRIRTAVRVQKEREAIARRVADAVAQARRFAEQKKFARALQSVDAALAADVTNAGAADLRAEIARAQAAFEATEEAEAARQRRLKAAAPALREARRALAARDYARARWAAENALAQAPDAAEIFALLQEIAAVGPPAAVDETSSLDVAKSDDTASLAPSSSSSLQVVASGLRMKASGILRRFQKGPQ
jgi:serine/threonine-protein kinase